MWRGAAAICVDEGGRALLVRGGGEEKLWGLPGGGVEGAESLRACCRREVWEETGHRVRVGPALWVKTRSPVIPEPFELHVFEAAVAGGAPRGAPRPRDPDGEVDAAGWFSADEIEGLRFHFVEDRDLLLDHLRRR